MPKGLEAIISFMGALYSGNFYVPLDVKSPKTRINAILTNLNPSIIVTNEHYKSILISYGVPEDTNDTS